MKQVLCGILVLTRTGLRPPCTRYTSAAKCGLGRSIAVLTELKDRVRTVEAVDDVPGAVGRTEDADISLAVAVKIGRNGNVVR